MDPDKMRQCMSLGYSVKSKSANTIGQCKLLLPFHKYDYRVLFFYFVLYLRLFIFYILDGNGFKTSTMRLGADVIVFSRCRGSEGRRYHFIFL